MKLLKPAWVTHDDLPIFSVDIHPDGSRFATGGQGEDSGRIIIWNMAPVVNEEVENDENVPKLLCQMDNHLACVNCVRWSFSGKFLASGGDDKLVMIWKISKYPSGGSFGSGGKAVHAETWRCSSTLYGHAGDVLDMAWSPHDAWLASCSVDNTVIVWNALKLPEMVAVLKGHKGLVKGVAWDPVGKYVASQSDDKTLRVWRTADWQQDAVIQEPFEECGGTTHLLRLSWSPDGQYLVSAHAMNGGGPTAQIIEREGWRQDKDFVGHRKAVTCVRFNSNILQKQYRQSSKPQQYCCCAIGSRDCSLSVWLTALKRPLVVLQELFTSSVLDLSWSITGLQLMACSWDGSVAFVEFSQDELGKPLSFEEKNVLHERMYGMSLASQKPQATVVETPELLPMQDTSPEKPQKSVESVTLPTVEKLNSANSNHSQPHSLSNSASQPLTPHKGPLNYQIETRTTDGRRRITPMFIPPAPDTGEGPAPFGSSSAPTPAFTSSSVSKSSIVIQRRDDVVDPNVSRTPEKTPSEKGSNSELGRGSNPTAPVTRKLEMSVGAESVAEVSIAGTHVTIKTSSIKRINEKSSGSLSDGKEVPKVLKRKLDKEPKGSNKILSPKRARLDDRVLSVNAPSTKGPSSISPGPLTVQEGPQAVLSLPPLAMPSNRCSWNLVGRSGPRSKARLEVENGALMSTYGPMTKVRVYVGSTFSSGTISCLPMVAPMDERPCWEAVLGCRVCGGAGNQQIVAVVGADATVHVMETANGHKLVPPFVLPSPASRITVGPDRNVLVITINGGLCIWDMRSKKCVVKNESLLPIMQGQTGSTVTITSALMTENGCPLVSLSSGKAYMYSVDFSTWMLIGDADDPVQKCATQKNVAQFLPVADTASYPLATIQSLTRSTPITLNIRQPSSSEVSSLSTVTYLEHQLLACESLNSPKEYRNHLIALARVLIHEEMESRLRLFCEELLGPAHPHAKLSKGWNDTLMGHSKHEILKEVLECMSSNLSLQRLYTEYSHQLAVAQNSSIILSNGVGGNCVSGDNL